MKKVLLKIDGMTCSACSSGLEKYLNKQDGIKQANVNLVMNNANIEYDEQKLTLKQVEKFIEKAGFTCYGGVNSPYVWLKVPDGMTSWEFFDELLEKANVVGTPGSGFGPHGEGYFRLTAFGTKENTQKAIERIMNLK